MYCHDDDDKVDRLLSLCKAFSQTNSLYQRWTINNKNPKIHFAYTLLNHVNGVYLGKRLYLVGTSVAIKHHKRIKMWVLLTINVTNREIISMRFSFMQKKKKNRRKNNLHSYPGREMLSRIFASISIPNVTLLVTSLWLKPFYMTIVWWIFHVDFTTKINCWENKRAFQK